MANKTHEFRSSSFKQKDDMGCKNNPILLSMQTLSSKFIRKPTKSEKIND